MKTETAKPGRLIFETGEVFSGLFMGAAAGRAGELVFNTSHSGYEEIATDPSYHSQIMVMTAPLQGNYGVSDEVWESDKIHIAGLVCLEAQNSPRDSEWLKRLSAHGVPVLSQADTRRLTLRLRSGGAAWGALLPMQTSMEAGAEAGRRQAMELIEKAKAEPSDWTQAVCVKKPQDFQGQKPRGPKIAMIDFGFKKNILRELLKRASKVRIFPSDSSAAEVSGWKPDGILLSNGPGDPKSALDGTRLVQGLLGQRFIFGICMGHQVLAQALGAETYKLKFGHRGGNHPIKDLQSGKIFMSAQNHGYAVRGSSLPEGAEISHINLNDQTVAGIFSAKTKCLGVQFHPESCPGPGEWLELFDFFVQKAGGPAPRARKPAAGRGGKKSAASQGGKKTPPPSKKAAGRKSASGKQA